MIGKRIRELRKCSSVNKSQADFASAIGLKPGIIGAYENGTRSVSDRTIADIVRVYGVNESWLRTGEGDMFPVPCESSGDEFAEYAKKLLESHDEVDEWTKQIIVRWCKLTPERQRIFIHVLMDLFADDEKQKELKELLPLV